MKNTTTTTHFFNHALYSLSNEDLERKLTNRVVTYLTDGPSSVKHDGVRTLVIKQIDKIGFSQKNGRRYIQGLVQDLDDSGEVKGRTLHVSGITKVKGKVSTAIALAKTVF
jgi:hypothetical protein